MDKNTERTVEETTDRMVRASMQAIQRSMAEGPLSKLADFAPGGPLAPEKPSAAALATQRLADNARKLLYRDAKRDAAPGNPVERLLAHNLLAAGLSADREIQWHAQDFYSLLFWSLLTTPHPDHPQDFSSVAPPAEAYLHRDLLEAIGLNVDPDAPPSVYRSRTIGSPAIEVHSVRMAARRGVRGQPEREFVVEVLQRRKGWLDRDMQAAADAGYAELLAGKPDFWFRRGCTLLIDAGSFRIRRVIRTPGDVADDAEMEKVRRFLSGRRARPRNAFAGGDVGDLDSAAAFAALHCAACEV